jgi:hypothetical protein
MQLQLLLTHYYTDVQPHRCLQDAAVDVGTTLPSQPTCSQIFGHLESIDFGDPRNMAYVPVIPQLGNVPVMYHISLYRNMCLCQNRPGIKCPKGLLFEGEKQRFIILMTSFPPVRERHISLPVMLCRKTQVLILKAPFGAAM